MTTESVTEQPTFGGAARDLRSIAEIFDKVTDVRIDSSPWVCLEIQVDGTDQQIIERTDRVAQALFGKPGAVRKMSDGEWFYEADGHVGMVRVHLYDGISEATVRELEQARELTAKEAELEKLRAEVAELRALAAPTTPAGAGPLTGNGFDYSREVDALAPVSPARGGPLHHGAMTEAGLVDETDGPESGERIDVGADGCGCPITEEIRPNDSSIDGTERVEHRAGCWNQPAASGELVDETPACYVPNGFQAPEVIAEREAACAAGHPDRPCLSAACLTRAAEHGRGVLAFTTPVVTYFSFGHGQTDPGTGKSLLDHYVTVVAPTYEACRDAMLASRFGRAWSFDYLAGTKRATEWIPRWTEHEVIVAPGTDPVLAEAALTAARDVLAGAPRKAHDCSICMQDVPGSLGALRVHQRIAHGVEF